MRYRFRYAAVVALWECAAVPCLKACEASLVASSPYIRRFDPSAPPDPGLYADDRRLEALVEALRGEPPPCPPPEPAEVLMGEIAPFGLWLAHRRERHAVFDLEDPDTALTDGFFGHLLLLCVFVHRRLPCAPSSARAPGPDHYAVPAPAGCPPDVAPSGILTEIHPIFAQPWACGWVPVEATRVARVRLPRFQF